MAGANRSMLQLILELRDIYNVWPFVLYPNSEHNPLKSLLKKNNIDGFNVDIRFFKTLNKNNNILLKLDYLKYIRGINNICDKLSQYNFNIIHSNSSVIDVGGYISSRLKVKHVWHLREFGDIDYDLYPILGNKYEIITYKNADAFIAISEAIKKHFNHKISIPKTYKIYNGIQLPPENNIAKHNNNIIQFICVGVIMPTKNQKEIVYAIDKIVNKYNIKNIHLTIVGIQDYSYVEGIQSYAKTHYISDYITILPETNDISGLLQKMDIGIMPSNNEAFGRVTIEYMLHNLAVIANDSGANLEIIDDKINGLIYPKNNVDKLAEKMMILIKNKKLILSLAKNGREKANNKFVSKINTMHIHSLYCNLLNSPYKKKYSFISIYNLYLWIQNILLYKFIQFFFFF